ncbi:mucoidy inhibitor MuiA family protein [Algoriphagus sp. H41]|uniref:Mucoidy inhibitor MuiA family protein n=1 Tax=Algoriphagus oliviformis TaxID=2811231 RepID=A0ABS3BXM5_9BACT|nr:mucoidy inhibitor MuiA family protein [Algoriphagus oliviformis]MBN7809618.1 mucoidy inhibitor MuiA family protein [Algoriphagus oliviformis]
MKTAIIALACLFFSGLVLAQDLTETTFTSSIQEVTLFLSGAQVFEKAQGSIPAGESLILIKGLSPYLDEKSIQAKGSGNFTIQAVNKRLDFLSEKEVNTKVKALEDQIKAIQTNQTKENTRLEILAEKASLLDANKNLGGTQAGTNVAELRAAMDFYETELTKISTERAQINASLQKENEEIIRLQNQIRAMLESENKSTSEIRIRVKAPAAGTASFELNYLVANAGWYPKYDVRVKNVSSPLALNYKAEVYQNTGVDWKNVKLRFSNANPNQSGQAPQLEKWELNYARLTTFNPRTQVFGSVAGRLTSSFDGSPLPGATVMVEGTTIGTVTDTNGNYSLTLPGGANQLVASFIGYQTRTMPINSSTINISLNENLIAVSDEVVVGYDVELERALQGKVAGINISGRERRMNSPAETVMVASAIATEVIENQTTVEIEVTEPYSIKSNGEKTLVDLKAYGVPAVYRYAVIPKLDSDAFLIAEIADWSQYSLLEGESNLYFEDGFVGRSILNASALEDTLLVSMGRDRSIAIQREKIEEYSKKRSIGSNITESRGYEISLRNNKSQPVTLKVEDQIPVSVNSSISVSPIQLSSGSLDPQTGKVTWEITLAPGEQKKLSLQYEVKYPKNERVILD